jgi:hypothetical protein
MKKIVTLPERFITGEPTILVVAHWNGHHHVIEKAASYRSSGVSTKLASEAFDYVAAVTPKDGETMILVNALGAFEFYDDNRNGDGFNELPYKVGVKPLCDCEKCQNIDWKHGWISEKETTRNHYKSFESGGIYQSHQNKDNTKSLGRVEKAFWNDSMHRVELLLAIVNSRAPEWINELENGIYSALSMGCHVRWDVCANCGHRAPTRKEYCDHCKFEMRKIDPVTGTRNAALNPSPRFFDISKVFRPADRQAYMIKKVAEEAPLEIYSSAELGEKVATFEAKQASIRKLCTIQKILTGEIEYSKLDPSKQLLQRYRHNMMSAEVNEMTPAGKPEIDAMAEHSLPEIASTLAEKGAGLTTSELISVLFKKAGLGTPDKDLLDRAVALQPTVSSFLARFPDVAEKLAGAVAIADEFVVPALADKLGAWLEKRAGIGDYLTSALGRTGLPGTQFIRDREPPRTDVLSVTDPNTGGRYTTTRGAVMSAHDEHAKADLLRRAGGTLLLSGAYRAGLGKMIPGFNQAGGMLRHGLPLAAGAYTANKLLNHYPIGQHFVSDEGYSVPGNAEMMKESSELNPAISVPAYLNLIAFDYAERTGQIKAAQNLQKTLIAKIPDSYVAKNFPLEEKVAILFEDLEKRATDPTDPPEVDFDQVCQRLGLLLVN